MNPGVSPLNNEHFVKQWGHVDGHIDRRNHNMNLKG